MYKESVGTASIPVQREGGCKTKIKVKYETKDLTAIKGRDYSTPDEQAIVFENGEVMKNIEICIRDDMVGILDLHGISNCHTYFMKPSFRRVLS